ncbi:SDR family oxidoreductase [Microbulbifer sp. SAOS-129_SWC]|uniref:SDR family oxidoreductase n=1 Tax=Microbulbifer sp. SAOS-129_SWC TaxID=3145235 RepID=UPI003217567E
MPGTILITGCDRGIGLEAARQFAADGWRVLATYHEPVVPLELQAAAKSYPGLETLRLDVTDYDRMAELARELRGQSIDILLNNAAMFGPIVTMFGGVLLSRWRKAFEVNTIAPYKMVETFLSHICASERKLVAVISSKKGSIADNTGGGAYIYRSTKSAVNQVVRSLSIDLRERGVNVVAIHPGWVRTAMGGTTASMSVEASVRAVKKLLLEIGPGHSGHFLNYDGAEIPW